MRKHIKTILTIVLSAFLFLGTVNITSHVYAEAGEQSSESLGDAEETSETTSHDDAQETLEESPESSSDTGSGNVDETLEGGSGDGADAEEESVIESSEGGQRDVHEMTTDELFNYIISLSGDDLDALYDSCDDLDTLMEGFTDEQKAQLSEKFQNGQGDAELISASATINPNGGTYKYYSTDETGNFTVYPTTSLHGLPTRTGYTFSGWKISNGSGTLLSGNASSIYTSHFTGTGVVSDTSTVAQTACYDTDGTPYTKYKANTTVSSSGNSIFISFPTFTQVANHEYVFYYSARINSMSDVCKSSGTTSFFEVAEKLSTGSYALNLYFYLFNSFFQGTIGSSWKNYVGTINSVSSDKTRQALISLDFPKANAGSTLSFDFDIKNVAIYDKTDDTWLNSYSGYGNSQNYGTKITSSTSVGVSAVWEAKQYSLDLYPNGGTFSDGTTVSKTLSPELFYDGSNWWNISYYAPTRTGYTLDGWFDAKTGGTKVYDSSGVCISGTKYWSGTATYKNDAPLTVYAQWSANTYINTLAYDANGGTDPPENQTATVTYPDTRSTFTLSSTVPVKKGYTFDGWYTSATDGKKVEGTYTVGYLINAGNQSATLYAHWKKSSDFKLVSNVSGNMGSRTKVFQYTMMFPSTLYSQSLSVRYADGSDGLITVDATGNATVALRNAESITVTGLTADQANAITVKETDYSSEGYTSSTSTTKSDILVQISFTNNKTAAVPTGNHNNDAYLWLTLIGIVGIVGFVLSRTILKQS